MNYSIERLSVDNLKHLGTLFRAVFHRNISHEFLWRKYDTKFTGVEFIGYLAIAPDHSPAAFYGVIPCHFRLKDQIVIAAQSADTMTHPSHRKQGLFQMLAQKTYALAKENGIEFIFGFPNDNSLHGFVKLNWRFESSMKIFSFKCSTVPFFKIVSRTPLLRSLYDRLLQKLYKSSTTKVHFGAWTSDGVVKDENFMKYKSYSGSYIIEVAGTQVWIKPGTYFKVGFVNHEGMRPIDDLLKSMRTIATLSGCDQLVFIVSENTELYRSLSRRGTPADSFPVGFYPLSDRHRDFSHVQFHYCDIDIF